MADNDKDEKRFRVLAGKELSERVRYLEGVIERLHALVHSLAGHVAPEFQRGVWEEEKDEKKAA